MTASPASSEEDYVAHVHWLGAAFTEADCALRAYVLMTHHVHVLLAPSMLTSRAGS
ncbi:MAG: hypothetical protein USCGTAYLOR_02433 [Chromatiales bacterium USCg_Taylor]|nr:MAG: hypothetical protein USCGTAYLOR_02433 [Chromatiales bacterium USCg_Taylor]